MHFSCERITKDSFSAKVQPRSFSPWYWKWSPKHYLKLSLSLFAPWYWNTRKWSPKYSSYLKLFFSLVLKYTKVVSKTFFETFTFTCFHNIIQIFQANFSWIVSIIKPDRRIWFRKQKWTFVQLSSLFSARLVRMRDQGKNICPNLLVSTFARK